MTSFSPLRNIRNFFRILYNAFNHFNEDDGWAMASHVALNALMALFPFLIFVAALAAHIGYGILADQVADLLLDIWPKEVAAPIVTEIHKVLAVPRSDILTISILVTMILASNGVEAVRTALNRAYQAHETRSFILLRMQSIIFVIIGAFASLALAFLGVLGPLIWTIMEKFVPAIIPYRSDFTLIRLLVTSGLLVILLIAAHIWLPVRRPAVRHLWPGILLTLVLWLLATILFAAYLQHFANYVLTYAGLASVVTVIMFLYLIAAVMIYGAELNATLDRMRHMKSVSQDVNKKNQ